MASFHPVTDLVRTKDTRTFWARNNRYTLHCEASQSSTPVLTGSGMSLLYFNSSGVFSSVTDLVRTKDTRTFWARNNRYTLHCEASQSSTPVLTGSGMSLLYSNSSGVFSSVTDLVRTKDTRTFWARNNRYALHCEASQSSTPVLTGSGMSLLYFNSSGVFSPVTDLIRTKDTRTFWARNNRYALHCEASQSSTPVLTGSGMSLLYFNSSGVFSPVTDLVRTKDTRTFWAKNNRYTLHCEASQSSTPVLTGSGMSLLYFNSSGVFSSVTDLVRTKDTRTFWARNNRYALHCEASQSSTPVLTGPGMSLLYFNSSGVFSPVTDLIRTKDTRTFWARNNRYALHCEASQSSTPVLTGSGMSLLYFNSSGVFSPVTDLDRTKDTRTFWARNNRYALHCGASQSSTPVLTGSGMISISVASFHQ